MNYGHFWIGFLCGLGFLEFESFNVRVRFFLNQGHLQLFKLFCIERFVFLFMREDAYFPRSGKRSLVMDVVFVCMLLEGIFYVPIIKYLFKIGYNIETFERHWYAC